MELLPLGTKVHSLKAIHDHVGIVVEEPRGLFIRVEWPDGSTEHFTLDELEVVAPSFEEQRKHFRRLGMHNHAQCTGSYYESRR